MIHSEHISKKYQIGKRLATMIYMDTGLKKSLKSMSDWTSKWKHAFNKQAKPNGWPKRNPHMNHSQQLQTHNVPTNDVENINRRCKRASMSGWRRWSIENCANDYFHYTEQYTIQKLEFGFVWFQYVFFYESIIRLNKKIFLKTHYVTYILKQKSINSYKTRRISLFFRFIFFFFWIVFRMRHHIITLFWR